jgi:hypothetical protein
MGKEAAVRLSFEKASTILALVARPPVSIRS